MKTIKTKFIFIIALFALISILVLTLFCCCGSTNHNAEQSKQSEQLENSQSQSEPTESSVDTYSTTSSTPDIPKEPVLSKAEKLLNSMTLEEKVGQLFIVRPQAFGVDNLSSTSDDYKASIEKYPVGGFTLFSDNIIDPTQLKAFTSALQESSKTPLFMSIDEEGGMVSRIANNSNFDVEKFPNMGEIGKTNSIDKASSLGNSLATYLKEYGFNWDFAPVCDVNTNPNNIVIGNRAFGSDPDLVSDMAIAEILALQSNGIIASAKHFPGHGDTTNDTHHDFVVLEKTLSDLENCELISFKSAIANGVSSIMISHITCPEIDSSNLPSSLSYTMCTDLLRNKLGFEGIIITDGMEMGAITNNYSSAEASILAIKAGCDIVLLPNDFFEAYDGVLNAVKSGEIDEKRIDQSVLRILELKEEYNIL